MNSALNHWQHVSGKTHSGQPCSLIGFLISHKKKKLIFYHGDSFDSNLCGAARHVLENLCSHMYISLETWKGDVEVESHRCFLDLSANPVSEGGLLQVVMLPKGSVNVRSVRRLYEPRSRLLTWGRVAVEPRTVYNPLYHPFIMVFDHGSGGERTFFTLLPPLPYLAGS